MDGLDTRLSIPRVDLRAQRAALGAELDAAIERVLASGHFLLGPEAEAFEEEFAAHCGAPHCVSTGSGTDAIRLALTARGIGPGDEVVTVSHTAVPTVFAVEATGARAVLVDVDPETHTMDPERAAAAVRPATRALLPVHLYGQCADLEPLVRLAGEHGLFLLEDACQAHGATYGGAGAGTVGHAGCFSFYPTKNLGALGDGGAVVTADAGLAERIRLLRNHGLTAGYVHEVVTGNSRLDELQAAVLRVKLPHLDRWNEARRDLASLYAARLRDLPVVTPAEADRGTHVFHLYVIRTPRRDDLLRHLRGAGVEAGVHYPVPAHLQPALAGRAAGVELPVTERLVGEILSLPMYPELGEDGVERVAEVVRDFFDRDTS
ncbi:MAG: DegT/DnrJ/EryC1/StrS family aminotransferase [Actinomycetota bacterium]|nr:DegT/DnrJ/EryC1/StrS family aminotransferase [Actinomycetota bacterium]